MNDIVITIRSEFDDKKYSGEKHYELRKRLPHIELATRCWIYEPLPVGKITGYFCFGGCIHKDKFQLWRDLNSVLGIDFERYLAYYDGQSQAYAWTVMHPFRIEPRALSEFGISHAPQSYQKVTKNPNP